jgi:pyridoxamine 5'-phosphate oxidase
MDAADLDPDPYRQFAAWLGDAAASGIRWPEAMTLATADKAGIPSARVVLLRGHDERGFVFYTNRDSRKGDELAENPRAAVVFYWDVLDRQVRAEGRVEMTSDDDSAAYFRTRPRDSRIAAWASPQSQPLGDRKALENLFAEAEARFQDEVEVPVPPFWGGYRLVPDAVEFWQSGAHRLHDRIRYGRARGGWSRARLAP